MRRCCLVISLLLLAVLPLTSCTRTASDANPASTGNGTEAIAPSPLPDTSLQKGEGAPQPAPVEKVPAQPAIAAPVTAVTDYALPKGILLQAYAKSLTAYQSGDLAGALAGLEAGIDQYAAVFGPLGIPRYPDDHLSDQLAAAEWVPVLANYASMLAEAGRTCEARTLLSQVAASAPDRINAYLELADVQWALDDSASAGVSYRIYLDRLGGDLSVAPPRALQRARDSFPPPALFPAYVTVEGVAEWGYVDRTGAFVIQPQYANAEQFDDAGLAKVSTTDGVSHWIDTTGAIAGDPSVRSTEHDSDPTTTRPPQQCTRIVNLGDAWQTKYVLQDRDGNPLTPVAYARLSSIGDDLYAGAELTDLISVDTPFRPKAVIDSLGRRLTDFTYYSIGMVTGGLIPVTDAHATYFLDRTGARVDSFPPLEGKWSLAVLGDVVKAQRTGSLRYLSLRGEPIWQTPPPDSTVMLNDDLRVLTVTYTPNIFYSVEIPQLAGLPDQAVQEDLNTKLRGLFPIPLQAPSLEMPFTEIHTWFEAKQVDHLLIIRRRAYGFAIDAAHGWQEDDSYFFDLTTGVQYGLADLFRPGSGYQQHLQLLMAKRDPVVQNGLLPSTKAPAVDANQHFRVSRDDLTLYYYPYEIAAYAAGFPTYTIPWSEMADLIDTDGAFWRSFHLDRTTRE